MMRTIALLALVVAAATAGAQAQAPEAQESRGTKLVGLVRTETRGEGVQGAEVLLDGLVVARTDRLGTFVVADVAPGTHHLLVRVVGFGATTVELDIPAEPLVEIVVDLAQVDGVLEPVLVEGKRRLPALIEEVRTRSRSHLGDVIWRAEMGPDPEFHFVKALARSRKIHLQSRSGITVPMLGRGASGRCFPRFWLDGRRFALAPRDVNDIFGGYTIVAVEVYESQEVPPEFGGPNQPCGAVVVWTEEGRLG